MAIEKRWEDCYNRSWRSKCYCVGAGFSCIGAWVTANRPCPALLFASLLLSYHVFHALTSSFFSLKKLFLPERIDGACRRTPRPSAQVEKYAEIITLK